ncbi:amidohydrolase family-domain-containing protein [Lophiotrema nucula]|uniref:Amidohydrolase family-domain-containing protein n=1 Tax=Lophiotrema nucula TaxID=690887 RepID=A0A6A5ZLF8_9PLEO|nr:amidohydrolase family-domain-containing protein [Lophiotrema nucula]
MAPISTLFWLSIPLIAAAIIYQLGVPNVEDIFDLPFVSSFLVVKIIRQAFSQTYCYASVQTLSTGVSSPDCFSVSNGKFSRVFIDETSFDVTKDARTGHVIPGLWDGHGHLLQYGELMNSVNLFGTKSMKEVQSRLVDYKSRHQEAGTSEEWIRGVGWDQANFDGKWPVSSDLEIDKTFKDLYVMLDRVDVHCIWVSEKVLSQLPSPLPDIPGGEIPTKGVFCDNAIDVVTPYYPKPSNERKARFLRDAIFDLNKLGIVGMHDAGVFPSELTLYKELISDEDWTLRVYAMLECETRNTFCLDEAVKLNTTDGKLHVSSVKLFADGALGSWGSAMIEPYTDKPSSSGSLLVNATTLSKLTLDWAKAGFQVNIHAIGDLANKLAVEAFTSAYPVICPGLTARECQNKRRFRIEHAQIIHPDQQKQMLEIGIIPSIQPTHATSDMPYAESRLGKQRTEAEAYRMRSLLPLNPVLGSDFPVEPANIFEGMYAALTRRSPRTGLDPDGGTKGWYPEETIGLEDALKGFTINPAYGAFLEGKAGVIEKGAYADWVVLDEPLESLDVESLRKATVKETWIGGKRVYKRPGPDDLSSDI